MGLAQNIVVKSRFSVPSGNGHGSRGGTPGDFILRYMSRGTAVENVTPTRVSESDSYLKQLLKIPTRFRQLSGKCVMHSVEVV